MIMLAMGKPKTNIIHRVQPIGCITRERVKRKIYSKRNKTRNDVFDYIEMFYNSKRKHDPNNLLSPVEYENRYQEWLRFV